MSDTQLYLIVIGGALLYTAIGVLIANYTNGGMDSEDDSLGIVVLWPMIIPFIPIIIPWIVLNYIIGKTISAPSSSEGSDENMLTRTR